MTYPSSSGEWGISFQLYNVLKDCLIEATDINAINSYILKAKLITDEIGVNTPWHAGNALTRTKFTIEGYTDEIAGNATLEKTISIGAGKSFGEMVVGSNFANVNEGVKVSFDIDQDGALISGLGYEVSGDRSGSAWSRKRQGIVTDGGGTAFNRYGRRATGNREIGIDDIWIDGSFVKIIFRNYNSSPQSLDCYIDGRVW